MKLMLVLILMINVASAAQIYFISGDNNYIGPEYGGSRAFADQAKSLYQKVVHEAKNSDQTTIVFYDPKGAPFLFFNKKRKAVLEVFHQGNHFKYNKKELNITSMATYSWINQKLGFLEKEKESIFYFYGEHLSMGGSKNYDFSHPNSKMGMNQLLSMIKHLTPKFDIKSVILHSCHNNDLLLSAMLAQLGVENFTASSKLIPNNAGNITPLYSNNDNALNEFIKENNHSPYPFEWEQNSTQASLDFLLQLSVFISNLTYQEQFIAHMQKILKLSTLEKENYFSRDISEYSDETLIHLHDFMEQMSLFLEAKDLDEFTSLLDLSSDMLINLNKLEHYF